MWNEEEVIKQINNKDFRDLKKTLSNKNAADIAEMMDELDIIDAVIIFRLLNKEAAVDVFSLFSEKKQQEFLGHLTADELDYILDKMYFDDLIDLLDDVPAELVKTLIERADHEKRSLINQFLNYPEDSAGSLMTIEFISLKKDMLVKDALAHIKEQAMEKKTIYTLYITSYHEKFIGVVSLRDLFSAPEDVPVSQVMNTDIVSVNVQEDQEQVAQDFQKYDLIALPVVDTKDRMVGIITVDDILDVIEEETTEDFQLMAAMGTSEEGYMESSIFSLFKNRIGWLLILMVSATFTGGIINRFESTLQSITALNMFIPMLMDTGGNSGNQSSTLVTRGLATGDITTKDFFKVMMKEFSVSLIVGAVLAVVSFVKLMTVEKVGVTISFVVSITLIFTIMMAKIIGGMLPIIAEKMKLDPAVMSGPLITTLVDALSLFIYFTIANIMLGL